MNFKTFGQILQEQIDYLASIPSPLTDVNIGSATRTLLEAVSLVLAETHYIGQELLARFYVSTASGQFLDMRASEYGITRVVASPTSRALTVSHVAGPLVVIPVGQVFATLPGAAVQVAYQVTEEATLAAGAASVDVDAISTTTGAATAIPDGTELRQQGTPLAYVDAVETAEIILAGTDRETDEHLRARVLEHLQHPPGPGNAADYERAITTAFAGVVESVTVVPQWAGPGTVLVLILGPGNTVPSAATVAEVQAYVDTWAPIGATATVAAPTTRAVDVRATVWPAPGWGWVDVEARAVQAIAAYVGGLGVGADVPIAAVGDVLWRTAGVGGAQNTDGGNYADLQQRVASAAYAAADVTIGAQDKATAGAIALTQGA